MVSGCELQIVLDRADRTYSGGASIRGRVRVRAGSDTRCNALKIERFWRTAGKGNRDYGPRDGRVLFSGEWHAGQEYDYPFELTAPASPPTYHGTLLAIEHVLEARADVPWAVDPKATQTFTVLPGPGTQSAPRAAARPLVDEFVQAIRGTFGLIVGGMVAFIGLVSLPFGIIFLLPGLPLFLYALYHTLAQQAVGDVHLHLPSTTLRPGESQTLTLHVKPTKMVRINGISATLRGVEWCASGSGKSRKAHTHVLYERKVMLCEPRELPAGQVLKIQEPITAPATDALSFAAANNKITWDLRVRIEIPMWPDWGRKLSIAMAAPEAEPAPAKEPSQPGKAPDAPKPPEPAKPRVAATGGHAATIPLPVVETAVEVEPAVPIPAPEPSPPPQVQQVIESPSPTAAARPDGDGELAELLRRIGAADRFSGARQKLVDSLAARPFGFTVEAQRVEWTLGLNAAPEFRSGRTVVGKLDGTGLPIAVRFPQSRNTEAEAVKPGTKLPITAKLAEWNGLHDRAEFEVVG